MVNQMHTHETCEENLLVWWLSNIAFSPILRAQRCCQTFLSYISNPTPLWCRIVWHWFPSPHSLLQTKIWNVCQMAKARVIAIAKKRASDDRNRVYRTVSNLPTMLSFFVGTKRFLQHPCARAASFPISEIYNFPPSKQWDTLRIILHTTRTWFLAEAARIVTLQIFAQ